MSLTTHWDRQYEGMPPWETEEPCSELQRIVAGQPITPCRVVEVGCGMGANAIWLAQQGFYTTAVDVSGKAIMMARGQAKEKGVWVRFEISELQEFARNNGPYDFLLDRGCYGVVRRTDSQGYSKACRNLTRPGGLALIMAGNAEEPEDGLGAPTVTAEQIRGDFSNHFHIELLKAFRFDKGLGQSKTYLGWSCLLRKKEN
jgi:2-polyprenyl-3-methyl-5-hydroxy-6-metoxy-1,4-benzoquinol methylase